MMLILNFYYLLLFCFSYKETLMSCYIFSFVMSILNNNKENLLSFHLHHFSKKTKPLSPFISKLRFLLNNPKYHHAIHWSADGCYIVVTDIESFKRTILENEEEMFKTNNFTSFVRQLNLYGFRKIPSNGKCDPMKNMKFEHLYFRREQPDLMHLVHRTCLPSRRRCDIGISSKNTLERQEPLSNLYIEPALQINESLNERTPFFRSSLYETEKCTFLDSTAKNGSLKNIRNQKKKVDYAKTLSEEPPIASSNICNAEAYKEHDYAISGLYGTDFIVDEKLTYEFLNRNFKDEKEVVQSLLSLKYSQSSSSPIHLEWDALSTLADVSMKLSQDEPSFKKQLSTQRRQPYAYR